MTAASARGTVVQERLVSRAAGPIDYRVYLPPGQASDAARYPSTYLLHGRTGSMQSWESCVEDFDELIGRGELRPQIIVMIDGRWAQRSGWWVDSLYTGGDPAAGGPGALIETAITAKLVPRIDERHPTLAARESRTVAGYSMGGSGALRYVTAHQDLFSRALILSPAVYLPQPPRDSSVRDHGAYGVGESLFDPDRYTELNYPAGFASLDPALPISLFIMVGDQEWPHPNAEDAKHDLDFESAALYNAARRVPGVSAGLRILGGGHDWSFWRPALREGLIALDKTGA